MKANISFDCTECGAKIEDIVKVETVSRLTHHDYGLQSVEYEDKVALILPVETAHLYLLKNSFICKSCRKNNEEENLIADFRREHGDEDNWSAETHDGFSELWDDIQEKFGDSNATT